MVLGILPGVEKIPLIKYLFATETKIRTEAEVIIVITPHIVRLPDFQDSDLRVLRQFAQELFRTLPGFVEPSLTNDRVAHARRRIHHQPQKCAQAL